MPDQASSIIFARMDVTCLIEHGIPVPVYFRSYSHLHRYCRTTGLTIKKVPRVSIQNAVRVIGENHGHFQDFLWVRAKAKNYRKALRFRNFSAGLTPDGLPNGLHADHVVNRSSLKQVVFNGHDPWIMLFAVPNSSNSGFGFAVERHLPELDPNVERLNLSPLMCFKLYASVWPKNKRELKIILVSIKGQFLNQNSWLAQIFWSIRPYVKNLPS